MARTHSERRSREGTKLRGRELNKEKWHANQRAMEGHQQINETESESRQIGARARGAVKQIAPTGARQRTKAALLLIDCRISPIFPGGSAERQWQMEADWTPEQRKGEGKKGKKLKKKKRRRRKDPKNLRRSWPPPPRVATQQHAPCWTGRSRAERQREGGEGSRQVKSRRSGSYVEQLHEEDQGFILSFFFKLKIACKVWFMNQKIIVIFFFKRRPWADVLVWRATETVFTLLSPNDGNQFRFLHVHSMQYYAIWYILWLN